MITTASRWSRAAARHPYGPGQRARRRPPAAVPRPSPAPNGGLCVRLGRIAHVAPLLAAVLANLEGRCAR